MLSKPTEYALRALVYIAMVNHTGNRPGFKEIARETDSPEPYMAKILQQLTRAGLVNSSKGRGGGFYFDQPEAPLPLYEVILIMEGKQFFEKCGFGFKSCDADHPCPLHFEYAKIRENFYNLVKKETIQSLASKVRNKEAVLHRLTV